MGAAIEHEIFFNTELPFWIIALRILGAGLLGGILGLEREWHEHDAGLRTHILIAIAAASLAVLTIEIVQADFLVPSASAVDPLRVLEAVTSGVAFLAAGAIIQSRGAVKGITTGAAMWLAGVIGLCAGTGRWSIALLATLIGVCILSLLKLMERKAGLKDADDKTRD